MINKLEFEGRIEVNDKQYYLVIFGQELGNYYHSIGYNCQPGRVTFSTKEDAQKQLQVEKDWFDNGNQNPYQ